MNIEYERTITEIIANSGMARSCMLQAITTARSGDFNETEMLFKQADEYLNQAHIAQTQLIQNEVRGEKNEITLLMIHAQDHLMTAITVKELVTEMVTEIKIRLNG